jgi:hypothetical protein
VDVIIGSNVKISNSTEQSPSWEANSHSASQEILRLFYTPKIHYRVRKGPPLVLILSQIHPIHTFSLYFPNSHLGVRLTSRLFPMNLSIRKNEEISLKFETQNRATGCTVC